MNTHLKLAREYAQLWAEYHTLQEQINKLQPHDIRWQIITDFKTHILDRLNEINHQMANAYKQTEREK